LGGELLLKIRPAHTPRVPDAGRGQLAANDPQPYGLSRQLELGGDLTDRQPLVALFWLNHRDHKNKPSSQITPSAPRSDIVRAGMGVGHHDRRNEDRETENVAFLRTGYIGSAMGNSEGIPRESLITSANVFSASATAPPPIPACVWDEAVEASHDVGDPDDNDASAEEDERCATAHRGNLFIEADPDRHELLWGRSSRGRAGAYAPRRRGLVAPVHDAWSATAAAHRPDTAKFTRPSESALRQLVAIRPSRLAARRLVAAAVALCAAASATSVVFLGGPAAEHAPATADWRRQLRPYLAAPAAPLPRAEEHVLASKHQLIMIPAAMLASR